MSVAWLPALWHLFRHNELAKPQLPRAALAVEVTRPIVGIILYAVAAVVGWFYSPTIAVLIFTLVVAFYAWSSRRIFSLSAARSRQDWPDATKSDVTRQRGSSGPLFSFSDPRPNSCVSPLPVPGRCTSPHCVRAGIGWALFRFESKDRSVSSADRRHGRA